MLANTQRPYWFLDNVAYILWIYFSLLLSSACVMAIWYILWNGECFCRGLCVCCSWIRVSSEGNKSLCSAIQNHIRPPLLCGSEKCYCEGAHNGFNFEYSQSVTICRMCRMWLKVKCLSGLFQHIFLPLITGDYVFTGWAGRFPFCL